MIVNEIAQWAVLAFLAVFVLGLTRQLGKFLVTPRQELVSDNGPALGKQLPGRIGGMAGVGELTRLMRERDVAWAAVLVVGEGCVGCGPLLDRLEQDGAPDGAPVLIAARGASPEYRERLERVADVVIVDEKAVADLKVRATPFGLVLDDTSRVQHKDLAWDLGEFVGKWKRAEDDRSEELAPILETTQVGGGR